MTVRPQSVAEGWKKAVRAVTEEKIDFRMRCGQAVEHFARVHSHTRQISPQAVGRIESDFQSASITVLARRCVRAAKSSPSRPSISSRLVSSQICDTLNRT